MSSVDGALTLQKISPLDHAIEEHRSYCKEIAEAGEEGPVSASEMDRMRAHRDKIYAEVLRLELAKETDLAAESALEFIREHGSYLTGLLYGSKHQEITEDLNRVMLRVDEIERLESEI